MTPTPIPDPEATRADRRRRAEARRRAADAELAALDADVSGPLDQFAAAERRIVRARTQLERTTADLATARAERSAAIAAIRATLAPYVDAGASGPAVAAAHGIPEYWVRPDPAPTERDYDADDAILDRIQQEIAADAGVGAIYDAVSPDTVDEQGTAL